MKTSLTVLVLLLLLLSILAGCARPVLTRPGKWRVNTAKLRASGSLVLLRRLCSWLPYLRATSMYLRATSIFVKSTTMDPGTTSAIYLVWPVSSEGAATAHHGGVVRATLGRAQK